MLQINFAKRRIFTQAAQHRFDPVAGLGQLALPGVLFRSGHIVERMVASHQHKWHQYHTLGLFKWQKLGIPYPLPDAVPPTPEQVKRAEELLQVQRYPG